MGQMETPRRDRCHQAKAFKPERSTSFRDRGTQNLSEVLQGSLLHFILLLLWEMQPERRPCPQGAYRL